MRLTRAASFAAAGSFSLSIRRGTTPSPRKQTGQLLAGAIALAVAGAAWPEPALAAPAVRGTLPEFGRPLSPAEGRQLRDELRRLSIRLSVREATLVAIAQVLGTNLPRGSFEELVDRVRIQAERAAELQSRLAALETQIAAVGNKAERSPATQALARARTAFDDGRLDDAGREFAALEQLRKSSSDAARTAWMQAVEARAQIAELRLDFDAAESLRVTAAREERRLSARRQWLLMRAAAVARYDQGFFLGDNAALERSIELFRAEVLPLAPRAERPLDWALSQNDLGRALAELGSREGSPERLEQAVEAYEAALNEYQRHGDRSHWAMVQNNLAATLGDLGDRQSGGDLLERAVQASEAAIAIYDPETSPFEWASAQNNLGNALHTLGDREVGTASLRLAVRAYELALTKLTREGHEFHWASTHMNLGNVLAIMGGRDRSIDQLERAVRSYRTALTGFTRERTPLQWAKAQMNLGNALSIIGEQQGDTKRLDEGAGALRAALLEFRRERVPLDWAGAQTSLGLTLRSLGQREKNPGRLKEALQAFDASLQEYRRDQVPALWAVAQTNRAIALALLGTRESGTSMLEEAVKALELALEVQTAAEMPSDWARTSLIMAEVLADIAQRTKRMSMIDSAERRARAVRATFKADDLRHIEQVDKILAKFAQIRDTLSDPSR